MFEPLKYTLGNNIDLLLTSTAHCEIQCSLHDINEKNDGLLLYIRQDTQSRLLKGQFKQKKMAFKLLI